MKWTEATVLYEMPFVDAIKIIEDAKCHGFEFRTVGHRLYFREIDNTTISSHDDTISSGLHSVADML